MSLVRADPRLQTPVGRQGMVRAGENPSGVGAGNHHSRWSLIDNYAPIPGFPKLSAARKSRWEEIKRKSMRT